MPRFCGATIVTRDTTFFDAPLHAKRQTVTALRPPTATRQITIVCFLLCWLNAYCDRGNTK